MSNDSKKHHYVPQYVLRNFGTDKNRRQIYVFDKKEGRAYKSSIVDAGSENYFNRLEYKGEIINFESIFQSIDDTGSLIIEKIAAAKNLSRLNRDDWDNLALVVAVQLLRTKLQRTTIIEFSKQLADRCRELRFNERDLDELHSFGDNESRLAIFRALLNIEEIPTLLLEKTIVLLVNENSEDSFWISDNPVVMYNAFPYGQPGVAEKGIEIYFPISPELCIGFYCPSIHLQLKESFSHTHPRPRTDNPWLKKLFHGMETLEPVAVDKSVVVYLNKLQLGSASRFIYSRADNFDLAINCLDKKPLLKEVRTKHSLSKAGEAPSPQRGFPKGKFIVFHGRQNHHMLHVSEVTEEKIGFRFVTSDDLKLHFIEEDGPFIRVEYYVDGRVLQSFSKVNVEKLPILSASGQTQARVKYVDESLNKLFEQIGK